MANVAGLVKELREVSGAGMLDCKKALAETDNNLEKALEYLRKKGLSDAAKKSGRIAAEGIVDTLTSEDGSCAVVVEVNSETDFVAKNEKFKIYVKKVAEQILKSDSADAEALLTEKWIDDESITVADALSQQIALIGENLKIRRFGKIKSNGTKLYSYIHAGGKVGVLVELSASDFNAEVDEAGKNICLQIASMSPVVVSSEQLEPSFIEKEKDIITQLTKNDPANASKPDKIIDGMIQGRLNKNLKAICLLDQEYVKADKMNVKQFLASVAGNPEVKSFVRFETGEGIAKKEENFAEEVNKAMQ